MTAETARLSDADILAILRGSDEIIASGGRTLLTKILKGSREKKVLELELDKCPVYGCFKSEKLEVVKDKIKWMIDYDFLAIQYDRKLPMIVYTERGWEIEANQLTDELLAEWNQWLAENRTIPNMGYLKDRNREMIFLLLDKVRETGDRKYIPILEAWAESDYKKVRAKIQGVIKALDANAPIDRDLIEKREASIQKALKGSAPQDFILKCWECGERFTFTIGEQEFYREMGFFNPKRCPECRDKRKYGEYI